jgi:ADP-ribose pyrophosphatase
VEFFPTPGISNERMIIYLAENLKKAAVQNPDVDEELEVHFFPVRKIDRMIRANQIIDGKTILGFLFYRKYFA